jgi:tetratricopeptide (TPR) repeat protein
MSTATSIQTVLHQLEAALIQRDIARGFSLLEKNNKRFEQLAPSSQEAIGYFLSLAQWVDLGYGDVALLKRVQQHFSQLEIADLRFIDVLKLKLAEAFLYLTTENLDECILQLDGILRAGRDVLHPELFFAAHFWKARAHRKKGEYEAALQHIAAARETAARSGASKLVAVVKIHESWLIFQKGERRLAWQLLDEAEAELRSTGHALSLGNIESARGRFVRRSGEYAAALAHFERAIAIYSEKFAKHPNCARALVNAAYVKRLIALDMQARIRGGSAKGVIHARYQKIVSEALDLLKRAWRIYELQQHQTGSGAVLVNAGHMHLEIGDIDRAAREGRRAFLLGEKKKDQILMARARVLQSAVEMVRAEEQLEEQPEPGRHASLAVKRAEEAVDLAQRTQNKRLLAEAYIMRGIVAAADCCQEWDLARMYAAKAGKLLGPEDRDHLSKELSSLKAKILCSANIDQTLRQWSEGQTGDKTFQQIQEEFAEIVIPRVWANHQKNITRVAQQLSISPKKIRRILRNVQSRQ